MQKIKLPWPPSLNTYYRNVGGRVLIAKKGRLYREAVMGYLQQSRWQTMQGRLKMLLVLYPPTKRAFDVDNRQKPLLDALEHGGAFINDEQIDDLRTVKLEKHRGGGCIVFLEEIRIPVTLDDVRSQIAG